MSPLTWKITVGGVLNSVCSSCASYNGTFLLNHISFCLWTSDPNFPACNGDHNLPGQAAWSLQCHADLGLWILTPGESGYTVPDYRLAIGSFNCLGDNVMVAPYITNPGYINWACDGWPATIKISPV